MEKVKWTVDDNEYRLKTPYGVATIIEKRDDLEDKNAVGARYSYIARLEHKDGTIESSSPEFYFTCFDHAEGWVLWGCVMEIDQPEGMELGIKRLFTSLRFSEKFLPSTNIETHLERIRMIKKILRGKRHDLARSARFAKRNYSDFHKFMEEFPPLDWQEQGDEYFAQVDKGRAVIEEKRNQDKWIIGRVSTYFPRIEHNEGVTFKGFEEISFEAAEQWVKAKLLEINRPPLGDFELELENLQATLALCVQVLPEDTAPIHFLRLKWIENRITEILL
jgi:hypothetical protein